MPRNIRETVVVKTKEGTKPEDAIPVEVIVDSIVQIGKAMKQFRDSRIREEAIITLITRASGVSRGDVQKVINNLDQIENLFLKPKKNG